MIVPFKSHNLRNGGHQVSRLLSLAPLDPPPSAEAATGLSPPMRFIGGDLSFLEARGLRPEDVGMREWPLE
jgi:hypothetical protein